MRSGASDVLRVSCVAALAFATAATAKALGVFVQPPHVYATVDASSSVSQQIAVISTGEDAAIVVTPTNFEMDDRGRPRSCNAESGRSLVPWMSLARAQFVLSPTGGEM